MLCEKIFYQREIPVEVATFLLGEYPMHYHKDIEIIYVMDGEGQVKCSGRTAFASAGDVLVVNGFELHAIEAETDGITAMMLHFDSEYFERYYPGLGDAHFSIDDADTADAVRGYMKSIMSLLIAKGDHYDAEVIEFAHNLLSCLNVGRMEGEDGDPSLRLRRVLRYAADNYSRKLTLREIADREGLSLYYLSHSIKAASGLTFQQLLNYVRVEASEELLLGTGLGIGKIAELSGFSAVRYYTKHFEEWLHMNPLEYRKTYEGQEVIHRPDPDGIRCTAVRIEELLRRGEIREAGEAYREERPVITIEVDAAAKPSEESIRSDLRRGRLHRIMSREVNGILAEPYRRFAQMDEDVLAAGDNYVITGSADGEGRVSVFLVGMDAAMAESLLTVETGSELLGAAEEYTAGLEVLLRIHGLEGEYEALRYRLDKSGIVRRIGMSVGIRGVLDSRERLIGELETEPNVYKVRYRSRGELRIRSEFEGIGIEMILLDRVRGREEDE